jgi:hypothetical protein
MMMSGFRVASLFLCYSVIGLGGDYVEDAFAQTAYDDDRFEYDFAQDFDVDVDVQVEVDPEIVVHVRNGGGSCSFEVDRTLNIPASLANQLAVHAGSGELNIEGRQGLNHIEVVGAVCASREEYLDDLTLSVDRNGSEIILSAHYPESSRRSWSGNNTAKIDLTILVPLGMDLDIEDSSGGMEISGSGALRIDDSSGEIEVRGASGSVWIDDSSGSLKVYDISGDLEVIDGSGSITIEDVRGSVTLDDGSGSIRVSEVGQNVLVDDDGSGSISVTNVAGNFTVSDDGSGSISHSGVEGSVNVPAKKERRRRRGN